MTAEGEGDAIVSVMVASVGSLKPEVGKTLSVLPFWYPPELVKRTSSDEVLEPLASGQLVAVGVSGL